MRLPAKNLPGELTQAKPPDLENTVSAALLRLANQPKAMQDEGRRYAEQSQQ
jgi:hypothetical protein